MNADSHFKKSDYLLKSLDKKKMIGSEIMKLFYKKIHSKMFRKKINLEKKVKLNFFDKVSIFFSTFFRVKKITKKIHIIGAGLAGLSTAVNAIKKKI